MDKKVIEKKDLEALLFVSKEPLPLTQIVKYMKEINEVEDSTNEGIEKIVLRWLFELKSEYESKGIRIRQVAGGFEMVTAPECHLIIEKVVPKEYETISKAQMDTLSIIAYNQNINRAKIAKIRGVKNPDEAIARLLERNLIAETESGFITTELFLKFFGINDLKELPVLSKKDIPKDDSNENDVEIVEEIKENE